MDIKLIVSDLDGTLLNSKKLVSGTSIEIMEEAAEKDVDVSIATGRMHTCAAFFGRIINSRVPVISCNGGMIRTADTNELVYEKYIDDAVAEEILAFLFENGVYCSWYIGVENFVPYFSWKMFPDYTTVKTLDFIETGKNYKKYAHKVTQFILRDNKKLQADILKRMDAKFGRYVSFQQNTGYTIDITPQNTNKATGLKLLAEYLHLRREEIMVLGDGDNDLPMFAYAGTSVAMANAKEQVKKRATFVTADCDSDGVSDAIRKVLNI
ncbi:Cof-type HAD-IIB family hydrolase [Pectinatus haikarae]|uniref:Cof-type HAD-IIB family hydrolase n=1 Tax=Pectinatus haikarae TaxID=349096 RepID=UPI0018C795A0|nr:Cof-type HAD-IIB family hydrolase [Pectinatus haikarae]